MASLLSARARIDPNHVIESDSFLSKWTEEDPLTEFSPVSAEEVYKAIMAYLAISLEVSILFLRRRLRDF